MRAGIRVMQYSTGVLLTDFDGANAMMRKEAKAVSAREAPENVE